MQTLTQVGTAMYEQAGAGAPGADMSGNGAGQEEAPDTDEETVDAEFREVGGQG